MDASVVRDITVVCVVDVSVVLEIVCIIDRGWWMLMIIWMFPMSALGPQVQLLHLLLAHAHWPCEIAF